MRMFPHTVTVYNMMEDTTTGMDTYNITILRGVFLDVKGGKRHEKRSGKC